MIGRFSLVFFMGCLALSQSAHAKDAKSSIKYESTRGKTYEIIENVSFSSLPERSKDPASKTTRVVLQKTIHSKFEVKDGRDMQEHANTSMELKVFRVAGKPGETLVKPIATIKNEASSGFFVDSRNDPLIVTGYEACCATTESFDVYSLEGKLIATYDGSTFYRIRGLSQGIRYLSFLSSSGNRSSMASEKGDLGILTWARADGFIQKISFVSKKAEGWGMAPRVDISIEPGAPLVSIQGLNATYFEDIKRPGVPSEKAPVNMSITLSFNEIGTVTIPIENDRFATAKAVLSDDMKLIP